MTNTVCFMITYDTVQDLKHILYFYPECTKSSDVAFTEDHWTDVAKAGVVAKSKTLAEQAAWDFVRKLPEGCIIYPTIKRLSSVSL